MIVRPYFARVFKNLIRFRDVVESNPVVGSSRKMIEGFTRSYNPIEVLFL